MVRLAVLGAVAVVAGQLSGPVPVVSVVLAGRTVAGAVAEELGLAVAQVVREEKAERV